MGKIKKKAPNDAKYLEQFKRMCDECLNLTGSTFSGGLYLYPEEQKNLNQIFIKNTITTEDKQVVQKLVDRVCGELLNNQMSLTLIENAMEAKTKAATNTTKVLSKCADSDKKEEKKEKAKKPNRYSGSYLAQDQNEDNGENHIRVSSRKPYKKT